MRLPAADEEESRHELLPDFCAMPVESMKFWLCKFVLESSSCMNVWFGSMARLVTQCESL